MSADFDLKSALSRRALAIDWAIRAAPQLATFDDIKNKALLFEAFLMEAQTSSTSAYILGENIEDEIREFR